MKKCFSLMFCLTLCVAMLFTIGMGNVFAEECAGIEEGSGESTTPTYPCTVKIAEMAYGDVLVDIEGGNVGDICTIYAKPYVLCSISSVKVNGVELIADEEGYYKFALVNGENVISAEFNIDQEQLAYMASLYEKTKVEGLSSLFTLENLFTLISWLISLLMGSGFLITWIKTKTIKSSTTQNIMEAVTKVIDTTNSKAFNDYMTKVFGPSFEKLSECLSSTKNTCNILARCMVLAQENTPEARLAIIKELTTLTEGGDKELAAKVKEIIEEQKAEEIKVENAKKDALIELEKANEALSTETITEIKANTEDYGQF